MRQYTQVLYFLHVILSSVFAENISASTTVMRVWGASEFIRKPRIKFVRKKIFCELKI